MEDRNELLFRGTVVSMNVASRGSTIRIVMENLGNEKNFPLVYVDDSKLLDNIKLHEHIIISGHTRNQSVFIQSTQKKAKKTVFVATSIQHSERTLGDYFPVEMLENTKYSAQANDINRIIVCGTIRDIYEQNPGYYRVNVDTHIGDVVYQCDLLCIQRQGVYVKKHLKAGDQIAAIAIAQTSVKEAKDKSKLYYENVLCMDISKVI